MRAQKFYDWMKTQTREWCGKIENYSDLAIQSRLDCLKQLENIFNVNLDEKVKDIKTGKQFLLDIRNRHIEDLAHTPLSNAFRHYFEFATGIYIGRIF